MPLPSERYQKWVDEQLIRPDPAQQDLLRRLDDLCREIARNSQQKRGLRRLLKKSTPSTRSLYIWGAVGRGKSMLMDMFFHSANVVGKRRIHFHAFMQEIHQAIHRARGQGNTENPVEKVAGAIATTTPLLCLDEMQVHDVADAMILSQLFGTLFARGTVVVFTSNRPPEELYQDGLQRERFLRFIALLRDISDVVELQSADDYRMQQIRAMERVYVYPLGPFADRFMAETFAGFTNHAAPHPTTLTVNGRALTLPNTAGKIALCGFHELCANALGAADYLAIAQHFAVVMLRDIPLLTPEKRNEAKRFVLLIDALYEARVKFICTAEAAPDKLYPQGHGAFEFQRTVSRLVEMQSEGYLS